MRGISLLLLVLLSGPLAAAELQLFAWERAPLVQQRPDGAAAGLVPEMADELFRRAGLAYRLSFLPLQRALHQVQQQERSCVLLVERQQEREPLFAWVGPLLVSRLGLYAKADDDLQLGSLEQAREQGHAGATLAIEVFCYRLAKSLAAMSCALPQLDGLIFTGGIGENSPLIRSKTVEHLKLFNLTLDAQANARCIRGVAGAIGAEGHPRVLVVPTNEERQIALDTLALLTA